MSVTVEQFDSHWLIRLDGEATLGVAAELKSLFVPWLASGKNLELDFDRVSRIDVTILQLVGVATREASRTGAHIVGRASQTVLDAARDAGFDRMGGFPFGQQEQE